LIQIISDINLLIKDNLILVSWY